MFGSDRIDLRALLTKIVQDVRASYWFLPLTLIGVAFLLSLLTVSIDRNAEHLDRLLPTWLMEVRPEGARSLLEVISQAVFGVAGVMFSMTIVAVSFASGNFGPRLIGNFMRDRGNQWSLGILVATFVYALLISRSVRGGADDLEFVPHISLGIAIILNFVSVVTVVFFVHHIPETINVSNITADLGHRLVDAVRGLVDAQAEDDARDATELPDRDPDSEIALESQGYVQTLNKDRLEEIARENRYQMEVVCPPGNFVSTYRPVIRVWGGQPDDQTARQIRSCFAVGHSKTEHQNLLFIAEQLVEMIGRALSPGINDPFTAINCLNWISAGALAGANYGEGLADFDTGLVRIEPVTFLSILEHGFGAAFHYVKTDPLTLEHFDALMKQMRSDLRTERDRDTLDAFRDGLVRD